VCVCVHLSIPNASRLICRPGQDVPLFGGRPPAPAAIDIKPIGQVLDTGRSFEDDHPLACFGVLVAERGHVALWMDGVHPLLPRVDAGQHMRELELRGQDQRLDVVDV
jgi:hypothetical protein